MTGAKHAAGPGSNTSGTKRTVVKGALAKLQESGKHGRTQTWCWPHKSQPADSPHQTLCPFFCSSKVLLLQQRLHAVLSVSVCVCVCVLAP